MPTRKVIVENDPVEGTDTHTIVADTTNPAFPSAPPVPPTLPGAYSGSADYSYRGSVTTGLVSHVRIADTPAAVVTSGSTLDAGEDSGAHAGPAGSSFAPQLPTVPPGAPTPGVTLLIVGTATITGQVGPGRPASGAGSSFVRIDGHAVLLDDDEFDTCGSPADPRVAVSSEGQSFVTVTE